MLASELGLYFEQYDREPDRPDNEMLVQARGVDLRSGYGNNAKEIQDMKMQRERLIKEMDKLIGPLFSRINDRQIFNPRGTGGGRYWKDSSSGEIDKQYYEEGVFWQEIAQYKYLAPPNLRPLIDKYLEIKLGSGRMGKWDDPNYVESESALIDAVKNRYIEIESKFIKIGNRNPAKPGRSLAGSGLKLGKSNAKK